MIQVSPDGRLTFNGRTYQCALGRAGVVDAVDKREGDGATPAGFYPIRSIWFRPDRVTLPPLHFPTHEITSADGWCDDPANPYYNHHVMLPFNASHEILWREDHRYDIMVVLGHNDDPPVSSLGSCIFWHVAQPTEGRTNKEQNYAPTAGCVAMAADDLLTILPQLPGSAVMDIHRAVIR